MNNQSTRILALFVCISFLIIAVLVLNPSMNELFLIQKGSNTISFSAIFLTGLLTGGLTCLAVQGGLLGATISNRYDNISKQSSGSQLHVLPIIAFLLAKLTAYTVLGALLGWFGSLFQLTISIQAFMLIAVSLFMVASACNILNIHPIFRYTAIQPPYFLMRYIRDTSKSRQLFAPVFLGFLTIFIPCGTTQAMMALSIASGNALTGALILFIFILGTSPLFFTLGLFTAKLSERFQSSFNKITAVILIIIAIFSIHNALVLLGNSLPNGLDNTIPVDNKNIVTDATIIINEISYDPDTVIVRSGTDITLHIINKSGNGCIQAFTIPKLNIQKIVRVGTEETIRFKAPNKQQTIPFMCSMGMFRGVIRVI